MDSCFILGCDKEAIVPSFNKYVDNDKVTMNAIHLCEEHGKAYENSSRLNSNILKPEKYLIHDIPAEEEDNTIAVVCHLGADVVDEYLSFLKKPKKRKREETSDNIKAFYKYLDFYLKFVLERLEKDVEKLPHAFKTALKAFISEDDWIRWVDMETDCLEPEFKETLEKWQKKAREYQSDVKEQESFEEKRREFADIFEQPLPPLPEDEAFLQAKKTAKDDSLAALEAEHQKMAGDIVDLLTKCNDAIHPFAESIRPEYKRLEVYLRTFYEW